MEGYIVIVCIILVALIGAATARPGRPDPEKREEAPRALAENGCGLIAVLLLAIFMVAVVLAF